MANQLIAWHFIMQTHTNVHVRTRKEKRQKPDNKCTHAHAHTHINMLMTRHQDAVVWTPTMTCFVWSHVLLTRYVHQRISLDLGRHMQFAGSHTYLFFIFFKSMYYMVEGWSFVPHPTHTVNQAFAHFAIELYLGIGLLLFRKKKHILEEYCHMGLMPMRE